MRAIAASPSDGAIAIGYWTGEQSLRGDLYCPSRVCRDGYRAIQVSEESNLSRASSLVSYLEMIMSLKLRFLSNASSTLFLLLLPFRLWKLRREAVRVVPEYRGYAKLVCTETIPHEYHNH